jgi:hypothetical protein
MHGWTSAFGLNGHARLKLTGRAIREADSADRTCNAKLTGHSMRGDNERRENVERVCRWMLPTHDGGVTTPSDSDSGDTILNH